MSAIIVLYAPTASGKTALALELKKRLPIEVVSADSRQVYRGLDIGTAKATAEEQSLLPHHCIDIVEPSERYSSGRFRDDALAAIQRCKARNVIPLVVGGSGLYVQSLCAPTFEEKLSDAQVQRRMEIRSALHHRLESEGKDPLYQELMQVDPALASRYSDRNPSRVIRALEYFALHGHTLSSAHQTNTIPSEIETVVFRLHRDTELLNMRIADRVHQMWEQGLVAEVESVLAQGVPPTTQSLQSVGYKEVLSYLASDMTREQAIEQTIIHTRQFAKRQRTWGRHQFEQATDLVGSDAELVQSLEKSILNILSHDSSSL